MDEERLHIDWDTIERELFQSADLEKDHSRARGIAMEADRIVSMILDNETARIDVEIAIRSLRSRVLEEFPDKGELFDSIYSGRFRRICEQFRPGGEGLLEGNA